MYRYSVFKIKRDLLDNFEGIYTKKQLLNFLTAHTAEVLAFDTDDRFRYDDEAEMFAIMVYKLNKSGDIVAIYDWTKKEWLNAWFL